MKKPYEMTIEETRAMYFPDTTTAEEAERKHLLYLAEVETWRQNNTYPTATTAFKANSVKRVQHYIDIRTPQERLYSEYQTFIQAMEKSIAICKEATA